jgi:hypothetical protein
MSNIQLYHLHLGNIVLIFVSILLGVSLRKLKRLPDGTPAVLNSFVVNIALPAMAIQYIHDMKVGEGAIYSAAMAWIVFVLGSIFILGLAKVFGWSKSTIGALLLTACLGNTSFVGLPLLEAIYGEGALQTGIVCDQAGSFLVLSTLGLLAATIMSAKEFNPLIMVKRIVTFPPFIAAILAVALRGVEFNSLATFTLSRLSQTLVPIALVSIGWQLNVRWSAIKEFKTELSLGLLYKLVLAPLAIAAIYVGILGAHGIEIQETIAEAAMAPMITGAIVAEEYGLNPSLSNLMIGIGIPLSLLTVPLWAQLLRLIM